MTQLRDLKNQVFLTLNYVSARKLLEITWDGYASHTDTDRGWDAIVLAVLQHHPLNVLHNSQLRRGAPELNADHLRDLILPQLEALLPIRFAMIQSQNMVAQANLNRLFPVLEQARHRFRLFDTPEDATVWLATQPEPVLVQ
jgi:hypothetical protein